jgi:hypothetical protein
MLEGKTWASSARDRIPISVNTLLRWYCTVQERGGRRSIPDHVPQGGNVGHTTFVVTTLYLKIAAEIHGTCNIEMCSRPATYAADRARRRAGPRSQYVICSSKLQPYDIRDAVRIMLSILTFDVLLLAAAVNQVILTLSGRRHADKYCVANRKVTDVADVVDRDNAH